MGKRMTATEKWDKEWFMSLPPKIKCLWMYINDRCDQAGMWEANYKIATIHIGDTISESDFKHFGARVEKFAPGKMWIVDHVEFQCGTLSEKSPAHKPIFKLLIKYNLLNRVLNRVSNTLQEKEIEKEEEVELKNKKESRPEPQWLHDFEKPDIEGEALVFPYDTPPMRKLWAGWKQYRWRAYQARYPMMGEQAALQMLQGMTYQEIEKTILEAISRNWKNLYPEKGNGKSTGTFKKPGITAEGSRDRLNSYTD